MLPGNPRRPVPVVGQQVGGDHVLPDRPVRGRVGGDTRQGGEVGGNGGPGRGEVAGGAGGGAGGGDRPVVDVAGPGAAPVDHHFGRGAGVAAEVHERLGDGEPADGRVRGRRRHRRVGACFPRRRGARRQVRLVGGVQRGEHRTGGEVLVEGDPQVVFGDARVVDLAAQT